MDKYIEKILDKRYKMLEIIGSGGMAVVYKALDLKLNRHVAVKILKDEVINDEELRNRFRTESEAVALLNHPNIVSVLDVNSSSNMEYFVMELIDGITLKQYMQQRGRLSSKEAVHFISLILSALGHAHDKNVVHRDVKPQNIMILRDGSLKVTDFGIARLGTGQNTLTPNTFGSVHYISPEQARGEKIDGRTDIYSVGVILYEMLAGKLPYVGDTPVSVAIQHLNAEPVPLSEIASDVPVSLETITMKAMCGDREYRYKSAGEMLEDINLFRENPNTVILFSKPGIFDSDEETRRLPRLDGLGAGLAGSNRAGEPERIAEYPKGNTDDNQRRGYEPEERKYRRYSGIGAGPLLAAMMAIVLLAVGVFAFYRVILNPTGGSGTVDVRTPNLVGHMITEVKSDAGFGLFDIHESSREYNDEYEEGMIISQDPEFGQTIKASGRILVVVSLGSRGWTMEKLVGLEYRQAEISLGRISDTFIINKSYDSNEEIESGHIISTVPAEGGKLVEGTVITLLISTGRELQKVKMPDLVTMSETDARAALAELKLSVGNVSGVESDAPIGQVVSQAIEKNSEIEEGTAVDFEVSIGPSAAGGDPTDPNGPTGPGTQDPVTPNQPSGPVTKTLPITLPSSPSTFAVRVVEDGTAIIYNEQHTPADGSVVVSITNTGSHMYSVYIDGVFKGDQVIVFSD